MASSIPERATPDGRLLEKVASLLGQAHTRAAIIGGMARNHWRAPRLTFDLDLTLPPDRAAVQFVVGGLLDQGFESVRLQEPNAPSGPDFVQLYHPATHQVVEIQVAKTDFQAQLIDRSTPLQGDSPLRVASPEDLIVLKLLAYRRKDQDDLLELSQMEDLDWPYVEHWAEVWQVTERLAELRAALAAEEQRRRDLLT